ncbi:TetR/AcrR family transcriptional regulator [Mycolicibacterium palauense]|uniref:TetR/AcrR family transcriptional regulator n=1 Tax=Mycolicibacterium palauense TaxID=2034511 RepID=UPI000BFED95C|nr:TetR family transcriptional regulator [Mycolicibacterium palauense]
MNAPDELGLRERKKIKTRETIRREALRLIEENGYAATTVDQIAEAAEVSPSTFFRYFPNKSALLIPDQLMGPIIDYFLDAPTELSPIAAYRWALQQVWAAWATADWGPEAARQQLLYSLPEAAGALYNEYITTIETITEALAIRLHRPVDDPELRITAGAMTGVMMAALHGNLMSPEQLDRGLAFLDAGLPLTRGTE